MSKHERNWQYAEQFPVEPEALIKARRLSLELGVEPVSRGIAAHLSAIVAMSKAETILEIGTGVGVSGLAMLTHGPDPALTTIDIEPEHQSQAKTVFAEAGINKARLRLIAGDATQVLPRLNTASYDLVLIDADPAKLLDFVEQSLQIVRPGGTIVIPHALGRVPDPAARDPHTTGLRDLLTTVSDSPAIVASLLPVGDGLLTLTRA